jgi:hypothetical protein
MRTTINLDEQVLAGAKRRASASGRTLGQVIEDALRRELAALPVPAGIAIPVLRGEGGMRHGIDPDSNRSVREALDDGLDPVDLR